MAKQLALTDLSAGRGANMPGRGQLERGPVGAGGRLGRADRRKLWLPYVAAGVFLGLIIFGFLIFTYPVGAQGKGRGSPLYQIALLSSFALTVLALRPWVDFRRLFVLPLGLVLALGWCWLRVSWAISPADSIRRVAQATLVPLSTFYIVKSLGYERFMTMLRWSLVGALSLCYLAVFLIPEIGIQHAVVLTDAGNEGTWRGIMQDKNTAGSLCAVTIIILLFDAGTLKRALRAILIVATAIFLFKSGSKTAMGIVLLTAPIGAMVKIYNPKYRIDLLPLAAVAAIAIMLGHDLVTAPFRNAIYEPLSFTGRGMIWAGLWGYIQDHWVLGSGFGSFWSIQSVSPITQYSEYEWVRKGVFVGHNGYLDLWATIGLPGLILAVLAVLVWPLIKVMISKNLSRGRAALIVGLIIFCAGDNLTESTLLNGDSFLNVVLMFALAMLHLKTSIVPPIVDERRLAATSS